MILKGWKQPEGAVHLVTPPGGPRPARVEVLADFLSEAFCEGEEAEVASGAASPAQAERSAARYRHACFG